jgi:hypothetical protein
MHLGGYLYEDYHDARSLEHKVFSAVSQLLRKHRPSKRKLFLASSLRKTAAMNHCCIRR